MVTLVWRDPAGLALAGAWGPGGPRTASGGCGGTGNVGGMGTKPKGGAHINGCTPQLGRGCSPPTLCTVSCLSNGDGGTCLSPMVVSRINVLDILDISDGKHASSVDR